MNSKEEIANQKDDFSARIVAAGSIKKQINDNQSARTDSRIEMPPADVEIKSNGFTFLFYDNRIPFFVGVHLEVLYESIFTSIARFEIYNAASNASTYIVCKDGEVKAVILFRRCRNEVKVYNEQIKIPGEEIYRFANAIFSRFTSVGVITFYAIHTDVQRIRFPFRKYSCLEDIVLELPSTPQEYLSSLGKNMRTDIKRYMQKFQRSFPSFRFEVYLKQAVSEQNIRDIIRMSSARMELKKQLSYHNEQKTQQLIRLVKIYGIVGVASTENGTCAGVICLRIGENYFMHVIAHDPQYDEFRLGKLCCYLSICDAISRGGKLYHFGWGQFSYKYKMLGINYDLERVHVYRSHIQLVIDGRRVFISIAVTCMRQFKLWLGRPRLGGSVSDRIAIMVVTLFKELIKIKHKVFENTK